MAKQTVALYTVSSGDRLALARESLADALDGAKLGDPDDAGVLELSLDAESAEAACDLVREAFARAGTGDDFVIRETTEGREMPEDDPRQAPAPDRSARIADAASAVAEAASTAATSAAGSDAAAAAREAAASAADSVREAATSAAGSVREAVDEKGVTGAAGDYAEAARRSPLRRLAPIVGLLLLLVIVRRRRG